MNSIDDELAHLLVGVIAGAILGAGLVAARTRRLEHGGGWSFAQSFTRTTIAQARNSIRDCQAAIATFQVHAQAVAALDAEVERAQDDARRRGSPDEDVRIDANGEAIERMAKTAGTAVTARARALSTFGAFEQAYQELIAALEKEAAQAGSRALADATDRIRTEVEPLAEQAYISATRLSELMHEGRCAQPGAR